MATKLRRTLFIGLGGTGLKTLIRTKKIFYDTYGEIPPMIGFLGIDTDAPGFNEFVTAGDGTHISLGPSEQYVLQVSNPVAVYHHNEEQFAWMPKCNENALANLNGIGAGQIRSNGRFVFTNNEVGVRTAIMNQYNQITNASIANDKRYGLLANKIEIHLVFSLSGGTGCGSFLNLAYMLQEMYLADQANIVGYAVMADIFRTIGLGALTQYVRANAYGAIKDIDYLTHRDHSHPAAFRKLNETKDIWERPFKALFLIDNKNANLDTFTEADQVYDMISLALVTSTGELSVATASVSDNVAQVINEGTMDVSGKRAWAASIGVCEIVFDNSALADVYTGKAVSQIAARFLNSDPDSDASATANNWITEQTIRENHGSDDVINYFMSKMPSIPFDYDGKDEPSNIVTTYLNTSMPKADDVTAKADALRKRIKASLDQLVGKNLNKEHGVAMTSAILATLKEEVSLCCGEMNSELNGFQSTRLPVAESEMQTSLEEMKGCLSTFLKLGRNGKAEALQAAVNNVATTRREIFRRQKAIEFYAWLSGEIENYIDEVNIIKNNLLTVQTTANNKVQQIIYRCGSSSFFCNDLTGNYVNGVICQSDDINFIDLLGTDSPVSAWSKVGSDLVYGYIEKYALTLQGRKKWKETTINDIMSQMPADRRSAIVNDAIHKSLPMLRYSYGAYEAKKSPNAPATYFFIGVADKNNTSVNQAEVSQLVGSHKKVTISSTGATDRIIVYQQVGVLPAFTIFENDVNYLPEYEQYNADNNGKSHWDINMLKQMVDERFSFYPRQAQNEKEIMSYWASSIIYGMVERTESGYIVASKGLGGRPIENYRVAMGSSRSDAYFFFKDNFDVLKRECDSFVARLDIPGPDNQLRVKMQAVKQSVDDGTYAEKQTGMPLDVLKTYPNDYELVDKEIEYILGL